MAKIVNSIKDIEFRFLNLHEEYTAKGKYIKKSRFGSTPCFAQAFRDSDGEVTYTIHIYKGGEAMERKCVNNFCFASLDDIKRHLRKLKKFVPSFKYKIREEKGYLIDAGGDDRTNDGKYDRYVLDLTINAGNIYHRYALNWIRYLYEFPMNMIINDAYRLKNVEGFGDLSAESLIAIVSSCVPQCQCDHRGGQSLNIYCDPLLTIGEVKARLAKEDFYSERPDGYNHSDARLSNVFPHLEDCRRVALDNLVEPESSRDILHRLSYWTSDSAFDNRVKKYREVLRAHKNRKKSQE